MALEIDGRDLLKTTTLYAIGFTTVGCLSPDRGMADVLLIELPLALCAASGQLTAEAWAVSKGRDPDNVGFRGVVVGLAVGSIVMNLPLKEWLLKKDQKSEPVIQKTDKPVVSLFDQSAEDILATSKQPAVIYSVPVLTLK